MFVEVYTAAHQAMNGCTSNSDEVHCYPPQEWFINRDHCKTIHVIDHTVTKGVDLLGSLLFPV